MCSVKTFLFEVVEGRRDQSRYGEVHGGSVLALKIIYFWINEI